MLTASLVFPDRERQAEIEDDGRIRQLTQLEAILCSVIGHSVRLRALPSALADQVLRRGEKALIFVQYSVQQKLLQSLLDALGVRARALLASLSMRSRVELIDGFNTAGPDTIQVLVCSYRVSIAGHNLQNACRNLHLLDPAPTQSAMHQVIGRLQRIGQKGQ